MPKIIIANWKMQLGIKEGIALSRQLIKKIKHPKTAAVVCPDYLSLNLVAPIIKKAGLALGAQDCAPFSYGAYTGEVSAANLKSLGVKYVIIGHSERREHLHENSAIINRKLRVALENKLIPILCVGEKLSEREAGETEKYLLDELRRALKGLKIKAARDLLIAYEPIWAISTNKNAKPMAASEADRVQGFIKRAAKKILKQEVAVLYGGSTNAANALDFLSQKNIDGLLVGGASLNANEFARMVN